MEFVMISKNPSRLSNIFKSFYFVVYHLKIFDTLIQSGFVLVFFPKIAIANFCKPFHNVIIISFSIFLLKPQNFGQEGQKLQKFGYLNFP